MSEEVKQVTNPVSAAAAVEVKTDVMAATVHKPGDPVVSPKTLLDAGCHFGHRVSRWNPRMRGFIYGKRNNLHIIDLNKSAKQMQIAYGALKDIVVKGGKVLFVGTKSYAQKAVQEEAIRSGSFYVSHRWLGGTLTNFHAILKRISLLKEIEQQELSGGFDKLTKKEIATKIKLKNKLAQNLEGVKEIRMLPNAIVIVDPKTEHNAIAEARSLNIPIFALGDTNTDPNLIDYLVPANDDGEASIRIIVGLFADAVVEGKGGEPIYAYKDAAAASQTMTDMLKTVDANEQIKTIRAKLRDDAIAMRKAGKGRMRKRIIKKNFHHYGDDQHSDSSSTGNKSAVSSTAVSGGDKPADAEDSAPAEAK
jgi:small subunit ribosomal protein S2